MTRQCEPTRLPDGLGYRITVAGDEPLPALSAALDAVREAVCDDRHPAVIVLRMSAAAPDVGRDWPGAVGIQEVNRWERAVRRLTRTPAAIITTVEGTCRGPALELVLAADYRICTADLRLLLPVNDGHFWPGTALHGLVQQVGLARARQIVMWGEEIDAEHALAIGLVDAVSADLDSAVHEATVLFGRVSDAELAVRRQLLAEAATAAYDDALGAHLAACDREVRRLAEAAPAAHGGIEPSTAARAVTR